MSTVRVVIASEHRLIRSELRAILESRAGIDVVAEARTGAETVELAAKLTPDAVLLDASPGVIAPRDVAPQIRQRVPNAKVILLCWEADEACSELYAQFGIDRCLCKTASSSDLLDALEAPGA